MVSACAFENVNSFSDGVRLYCQDVRWNITLRWNGCPNDPHRTKDPHDSSPNGPRDHYCCCHAEKEWITITMPVINIILHFKSCWQLKQKKSWNLLWCELWCASSGSRIAASLKNHRLLFSPFFDRRKEKCMYHSHSALWKLWSW